jgi:hypothetical protein
MFLPVLLVRDFGLGGFVVFAIPNILGAAGMGWVLRHEGASERLLVRHLAACFWFSRITVAFQFFFLGWMLTSMGFPLDAIGGVILVVIVLGLSGGLHRSVQAISMATLLVSWSRSERSGNSTGWTSTFRHLRRLRLCSGLRPSASSASPSAHTWT